MSVANIVNFLIIASASLLSVRLYWTGLQRTYRAFFTYLVFFALQNTATSLVDSRSNAYFKIWISTEPVNWLLSAWIVFEIYSLVVRDYEGLYTAGRRSLVAAFIIALSASALSLFVPGHSEQGRLTFYYYIAERAVSFSLAVFLMTILALLMRYPITLNRNTIVHSLIFSLYFLSTTLIFLVLTTRGLQAINLAVDATMAVNLGTLVAWLALLNPAGEKRPQQLRPGWMPGDPDALVQQLNSLNVALLRAVRH